MTVRDLHCYRIGRGDTPGLGVPAFDARQVCSSTPFIRQTLTPSSSFGGGRHGPPPNIEKDHERRVSSSIRKGRCIMTREELGKEIVKLVCEKGKGLSTGDAIMAMRDAEALFYKNTKMVDGMFAQSKE